ISVYIWLLLLAFGGHVLVGYGLVTLGEFLQLALLCVVITLLSGILQTGAGAGPGPLDHLNDPDKRNRVATRSLHNLQHEISAYRAAKDGRGYVHSSDQCTYAVLKGRVRWEMEQYLGSGGPPCLWKWICLLAWLSCACELLYQSIDAGMSSLNVAAVRRNLVLVWNEIPCFCASEITMSPADCTLPEGFELWALWVKSCGLASGVSEATSSECRSQGCDEEEEGGSILLQHLAVIHGLCEIWPCNF
ncbi:unnamed protein product, partial [Cladocopium goreaui]